MNYVLPTLFLLLAAVKLGSAIKCYECNVWKAGYGHLCDNPRIREGCTACMKVDTTVRMGYYKNKPRESNIISRVCAMTRTIHFSHECHPYTAVAGDSIRCYCDTDLCNSAPRGTTPTLTTMAAVGIIGLFVQKILFRFHDLL